MRKLVVLNPLIHGILETQDYNALMENLHTKGFIVADAAPGKVKVKEEYRRCVANANNFPVIDSRCPYVADMVRREFNPLEHLLAPIDPILITGAKMRKEEFDADLTYVVSPCEGFERYNEDFMLIHTWRQFRTDINFRYARRALESTPVPIGFFNDLDVKLISASGEAACRRLLSDYPSDAKLLELLHCEGGCHKGDGLY